MHELKGLIKQFMPFAQEQMGFNRPPKLFLRQDTENAANPLGKTGFYDPQAESITIYVSNRHPKDILRSLAHELMHHTQKCNGDFDNTESQGMGEQGYAQNNTHMRNMEIQAYQASIVFRDWEDSLKETIYYEHLQKGANKAMSTKEWKNKEISILLTEAWGFGFNLDGLTEDRTGSGVGHGPGDDPSDSPGKSESKGEEKSKEEEEEEHIEERAKRASPNNAARGAGGRRLKPEAKMRMQSALKQLSEEQRDQVMSRIKEIVEEAAQTALSTVGAGKLGRRPGAKQCEDGSEPDPQTGDCPEERRTAGPGGPQRRPVPQISGGRYGSMAENEADNE